jgi:PKD repeat protein
MKPLFIILLALVLLAISPVYAGTMTGNGTYTPEGWWISGGGSPGSANSCNYLDTNHPLYNDSTLSWQHLADNSWVLWAGCCAPNNVSGTTWGYYGVDLTSSGSYTSGFAYHGCTSPEKSVVLSGTDNALGNRVWMLNNSYTPIVADFNGAPLSGVPLLIVAFTDNSTNTATSWNWSVSPTTGVYVANNNTQNTSMIFTNEGNFTITHGASSAGSSSIKTRTDYIWVQNGSVKTITYVTAIAQASGNPIPGAVINLKDVQNSSWTNMTTGSSATANITTLKGHTIDGYASATGFNDNDYLGMPAGEWYSILLMSPFSANVTAGNVTLNVDVYDSFSHSPINGAGVTVISNVSAVDGYTNSVGIASFAVKNKTTYLVDVEAIGQQYKGATQSVYTGTGSGGSASVTATFYLDKSNVITPTATVTTLPGGGTPVPTQTYLPGCDPSSPTYDAATCRGSHSNSALNFLADNMDNLIMVCVFVTIMYLFGIRLGH